MSHIRPWECQCKHCWTWCHGLFRDIREKPVISEVWKTKPRATGFISNNFLKMSEVIIGGPNCVLMFEKPKQKSIWCALKLVRFPVCGLLDYFPVDELGTVKLQAWELCSIPGGVLPSVAKRTRGGERSDFFTAVAAHMPIDDSHQLALQLSTRAIKSGVCNELQSCKYLPIICCS